MDKINNMYIKTRDDYNIKYRLLYNLYKLIYSCNVCSTFIKICRIIMYSMRGNMTLPIFSGLLLKIRAAKYRGLQVKKPRQFRAGLGSASKKRTIIVHVRGSCV